MAEYYNEKTYEASKKYKKNNIKRVPLDMQIEEYEKLKAIAEEKGEKINQYIKRAIAERMERDNTGAGFSFCRERPIVK